MYGAGTLACAGQCDDTHTSRATLINASQDSATSWAL